MTPIPARILRPIALACPTRPRPTERDRQRRAYILEAAQAIFEAHGRAPITLQAFALATGLSASTIRREIVDLHHLFHLVLLRHLDAVLAAIGAIPGTGPEALARRRAEYRRATCNLDQSPSRLQILFLTERFALPPDQLEPLETQRRIIGHLLGGESWEATLALLDCPALSHAQIESMLAAGVPETAPAPTPPEPTQIALAQTEPAITPWRPPAAIPPRSPFRVRQLSPRKEAAWKNWGNEAAPPRPPGLT